MSENKHLYVLWTNDNPITAEKMVFMYTINSLIHGWWEKVTLIVWGATTKLVSENADIQEKIKETLEAGVHVTACKACADQLGVTDSLEKLGNVTACKACADQLGVTDSLEKLGIEVIYWGVPLTEILTNNEKLLTI